MPPRLMLSDAAADGLPPPAAPPPPPPPSRTTNETASSLCAEKSSRPSLSSLPSLATATARRPAAVTWGAMPAKGAPADRTTATIGPSLASLSPSIKCRCERRVAPVAPAPIAPPCRISSDCPTAMRARRLRSAAASSSRAIRRASASSSAVRRRTASNVSPLKSASSSSAPAAATPSPTTAAPTPCAARRPSPSTSLPMKSDWHIGHCRDRCRQLSMHCTWKAWRHGSTFAGLSLPKRSKQIGHERVWYAPSAPPPPLASRQEEELAHDSFPPPRSGAPASASFAHACAGRGGGPTGDTGGLIGCAVLGCKEADAGADEEGAAAASADVEEVSMMMCRC